MGITGRGKKDNEIGTGRVEKTEINFKIPEWRRIRN